MKNNNSRRSFLKKGGIATLGVLAGIDIVYAANFPKKLEYIGLNTVDSLIGKDGRMVVLNDRPMNAETPPHLLDPALTPNNLFFVRNNGLPPVNVDSTAWTLTIEGESAKTTKTYTIKDLKTKFKEYTYQLTLECGGNGRKEFNPPAKGNQWGLGAVGCAAWTGVRLKDVLEDVGMKSNAVYIGYYGSDTHLSGDPNKSAISRGVPISKAMEDESLIAWAMNGEKLPELNGFPLRLVFGGWPASCSGKWLSKIVVRNKIHDGTKMKGQAYRVPCKPVSPGTKVADEDMCIIESMPVKSILTYPKTGAMIKLKDQLPIRGHAWAGDLKVAKMEYSIDFGSTWKMCTLTQPKNRHAWQQFSANVSFPQTGYFEVWARATDTDGKSQPMILPGWNPKGYLNNACHRIAIKVE
ncbi:MAG: sulfite oxidase [Saprospiraceae bacterium]|nr:sulfite oxidase [Saprospiraceae bacterium]